MPASRPHPDRICATSGHIPGKRLVFALFCLVSACANGPQVAYRTLAATAEGARAAADGLAGWNARYEARVAEEAIAAGTPEQGQATLRAYRAKRAIAERALLGLQAAIVTGYTVVGLVELGQQPPGSLGELLAELVRLGRELAAAIAEATAVPITQVRGGGTS